VGQKKFFTCAIGIIFLFLVISMGVFLGCQSINKNQQLKPANPEEKDIIIEKAIIQQHVTKLTSQEFQGRRAGTQGDAEAALFLAQELKRLNLRPIGDKSTYFQSFPVPDTDLKWEDNRLSFFLKDKNSSLISDNVLGVLESTVRPNEYIILCAHYDHLGVWSNDLYPGANDNASGVSAVLEIARVLKEKTELPYSIIIAFWGAEEMGLIGSNFFIDNPTIDLKNIKFALNLDSIGKGPENNFLMWSEGPENITSAAYKILKNWQDISFILEKSSVNSSDHKAIARAGIPAITVLADEWLINNHTPGDDAQDLNYSKIHVLAQKIVEFLSSPQIEELLEEES
jgi:aminopeptidase YwaD